MADAVTAFREFPFNIQIRTSDAAGPALKAAFMIDRDPVPFQTINISRAKIQARLTFTFILADRSIDYFKMAFLINLKTVQK